jgi:preprotein translocase subunit YajC
VSNIVILLAMAGSGQPAGQSSPLGFLLPIILIFAIMYLLIFRPQAKKQKEHQLMVKNVQKGDQVITAGGILGTVAGVAEKDNFVILKIDENVKVKLIKTSIARVLTKEETQK